MASIKITKNHTDSKESARAKVEAAIAPHVAKFGLKKTWEGDTLKVSGKGMDGALTVTAASVNIDMKLGLPASMVSSQIESQLRAELTKAFG